jgi:predicted secreted protein
MRRRSFFLSLLVLVASGQVSVPASPNSSTRFRQEPRVINARLNGKKLFVFGEDFSDGAVIIVDGEPAKTRSDPENPSGVLIAKKAGKWISPGKMVKIAVLNNTGATSLTFDFFSGLILTLDDTGKTISLKVGDKFQVRLKKDGYEWTLDEPDSTMISKLENDPLPPGVQGLFQATKAGTTQLSANGDLPCRKSTPPCMAPTLGFRVTLVIE